MGHGSDLPDEILQRNTQAKRQIRANMGKYGQKPRKIAQYPQKSGKNTTFCLDFVPSNVAW
jgi:hypothetical protein